MEKISAWKGRLGKRFAFIFALLFLVILAISLRNSAAYESELKVLVLLESESAALQQQRITDVLAQLPLTLDFYDYMLDTSQVLSESEGKLSASRRLEAWGETLDVGRIPDRKGAIIVLKAKANSGESAQIIVRDTFRALVESSSRLYDAKTEVQLRAIDGPHTLKANRGWLWLLSGSIALALAGALMLEYAWDNLENAAKALRSKTRTDISEKIKALRDLIVPAKGEDAKGVESLEGFYEKETPEEKKEGTLTQAANYQMEETPVRGTYPNFPEMPVQQERKALAPDNLPIADAPVFGQAPDNLPIAEKEVIQEQPLLEKEPTAEELKARLNQLLKGRM